MPKYCTANINDMNIVSKYQSGGPLTVEYQPLERPLASLTMAAYAAGDSNASASSAEGEGATSKKSSSDDGLLSKDLIKEIYANGLPSDVSVFMSKMGMFSNSLFGQSNAMSSSNYKQLLALLPQLKFNKESYTKALEQAYSKGTMNEPAITSDGKVFVLTEEGITTKAVSEVEDGEKTLSVSELSQLRAYSKDMAFDNGTLTTAIGGSISLTQVFKDIQEIVGKIGSTELGKDQIGNKSGSAITRGLETLLKEAEDGVYKVHYKTKDSRDQATYALKYIQQTLSPQEIALLQEYSRRNGKDLTTGPLELIQNYIQGQLDFLSEQTISNAPDGNSGSGDGKDGKGKNTTMTFAMQMITGDGLAHSKEYISFGNSAAYQVDVQISPQIPIKGGGVVKPGSASQILSSELGGIIDKDSMHIGDQAISTAQLSRMYYDDSGVKAMWLPVTKDANGKDMPNWKLTDAFLRVMQQVNKLPNPTPQMVNKLMRAAGLSDYFDANGRPILKNYRRFACISVIGDETSFKDPDENSAYTKLDDETYEQAFSLGLGSSKSPLKIDGDLYRANIFIPLYDSPSLARQASGNPSWVKDRGWAAEEEEYSNVQAQKEFVQTDKNTI